MYPTMNNYFLNKKSFIIPFMGMMVMGLLTVSCSSNNDLADAYGNFESEEVVVSAEESGRLLAFNLKEGDKYAENTEVGLIDTTMLSLKRSQLVASRAALDARSLQIAKTAAVQKSQLDLLQKELGRARELSAGKAITTQKFDQIEGETQIAQRQLEQILSQNEQVKAEKKVMEAQLQQVEEQLRRCRILVPQSGTVLQKYAEAGELTAAGKPLFKMADLENMFLRAYISGTQLAEVEIGQQVTVRFDRGTNDFYQTDGVITWVAASAEFTPKIIQTKEERVDLVYAVKVQVKNDGRIKIGMPGEVVFKKSEP